MTQPTTILTHPFTAADLDLVEDDLAVILENTRCDGEEFYLNARKLMEDLQASGHTRARIVGALERLVERGVLATTKPGSVTFKTSAGTTTSKPQKYVTTRQQWFTYLAHKRSLAEVQALQPHDGLSVLGVPQEQAQTGGVEATGQGAGTGESGKRGRPRGSNTAASDLKLFLDWKAANHATRITKRDFVQARGLPKSALHAIERGRAQEKRKRSGQ